MYPNQVPPAPSPAPSGEPHPSPDYESRHSVFPYMVPNRSNFNPFQVYHMEQVFNTECRPSRHVLEILSDKVNIPLKNVQIWFQNRRARARKKGEPLQSKNLKALDTRNLYYQQYPNQTTTPMSDVFPFPNPSNGYPILPMPSYDSDRYHSNVMSPTMINPRLLQNDFPNHFHYRRSTYNGPFPLHRPEHSLTNPQSPLSFPYYPPETPPPSSTDFRYPKQEEYNSSRSFQQQHHQFLNRMPQHAYSVPTTLNYNNQVKEEQIPTPTPPTSTVTTS